MKHSSLIPTLMLAICLITPPVLAQEAKKSSANPDIPAPAEQSYTIQPGDMLEITVWKEKDLQREVLVRPDGGLSFPLANDISATGKTVEQLRKEIGVRLGKYIPDPVVNVAVKQAAGSKIYVIGKVNHSGEFTINRYVDVMQAISIAGGMTPFASANSIKILRRLNGVEHAIPFKYGQVEDGRHLEQNIVLQSGDTVVVP